MNDWLGIGVGINSRNVLSMPWSAAMQFEFRIRYMHFSCIVANQGTAAMELTFKTKSMTEVEFMIYMSSMFKNDIYVLVQITKIVNNHTLKFYIH